MRTYLALVFPLFHGLACCWCCVCPPLITTKTNFNPIPMCFDTFSKEFLYFLIGCIESLKYFLKMFSALYLSFVSVSSVNVVNVEYFLDISCWCSDVPDAASPRYKPLLSPDDKMLTIIGDRTLGLAMARYVYWATDLSVSSPMISDCSQFLHSQGVQQLTFITFIALLVFL